ncbi:unnamed protein product, partial [Symbiodinium necroappetens]
CTDVAIWCGLWELVRSIPGASALILPPKIAGALLELGAADQLRLKHHPALALPEGMLVFVPFVHQEHWTLLVLSISNGSVLAEVFDGVPGRNLVQAKQLSTLLCELAGRSLATVTECCTWPQRTLNDCGAILLAHAAGKISGTNDPAQLQEAQAFIATFPPLPHCLLGRGGLSSEQEQALQKLLVSKGVPSANVAARLQQAVSKLGPGPIAEALHSRNPWQALKSAGSRPGTLFKWVQPDELEMHIEQRAQERFGTEVPRAKAKKQKQVKRTFPAPLHVDPLQLQLAPGSFTSQSGTPLAQLSYQEVQSQATGICFVTQAQAAPFVQEAILVQGSLVQLGDECVQLAATDIAEVDHLPTVVCRLSLYRDECKSPWDQITDAPIRALLQQVPELQVCKATTCDQCCPAFHAAVDEVVDHLFLDVWARQWCRLSGGKAKAGEAELFQAFVRVPSSALPHLFKVTFPGLYIEPRAADGSGPHSAWAVVWLPGANAAQALHSLKTTSKAVALTRLGAKYGLRTKEADEQAVFEALRPQHQFVKVRIIARYRLHPLPHGFQRHNLVNLLKQWSWNCRPLQPDRGDATGCAWLVGASCEPPAQALPLGTGYVLASKVKDVGNPRPPSAAICASTRTKKALLIDDDPDEQGLADPWMGGRDPWSQSRAQSTAPPSSASSSPEAVLKLAQLETDLKANLKTMLQQTLDERDASGPPPGLSEQDKRLHTLETSVQELRHQGTKFEGWFQSFGTKVADQAQQLEHLASTVKEQQAELSRVKTDVQQTVQSAVGSLQSELTNQMAAQLAGQMEQITELFASKKARH